MYRNEMVRKIKEKAEELGFESCGIVKIHNLHEYEQKLDERIQACPASKPMLELTRKYAHPEINYEWAKAVIVCVTRYGKYKVPRKFEGQIGKYYLFDHKLQPHAKMNKNIVEFEKYIEGLGIKAAKELHGVTSARLAAEKAGLGLIRKNNFLYTKSGSWVNLDTWVIDHDLELYEEMKLEDCPDGCNKCIDACPTKALAKPYCTDVAACVTRLTWGIRDLPPEAFRKNLKGWIYGCDECQNACPMNKGTWQSDEEYPGLDELAEKISLEKLFLMEDDQLLEVITPKFWFIRPDSLWIWKVNVLRGMANGFKEEYGKYIQSAKKDKNEKVREMAEWAARVVGL